MEKIKITKSPKAYETYLKIERYVEEAIHSNALSRVLFILIDSKPEEKYNDAIAKRYYETSESKKLANPKVTAIFLRKLRDARIIKRIEKQGKIQLYDVDWNGLFDILRFRNFLSWDLNEVSHLMHIFYSPYLHGYSDKNGDFITEIEDFKSKYPEQDIEQLTIEFVDKYFKPYYERATRHYKTYRPEPLDENGFPLFPEDTFKPPKNFDTIDFDIYTVLKKFDNAFFIHFPNAFQSDIEQLFNNKKIKQTSKLTKLLLDYYERHYQDTLNAKDEFCQSSQPEYVLLESFNREIKKLDYQIQQYDIDEYFEVTEDKS